MFPYVSTLDLLIALSNTVLNSLKPLLTLNSEDKCLPILTTPYISVFKILHNLNSFF